MSMFKSGNDTTRRIKLGAAAIGLLAIGGVAGGAIGHHGHPPIAMAPTHVVAIRNLATSEGIVTIKGRVAESFGSRFVVDDGTGRTLIDGGPRVENDKAAPLGATVLVQGHYDHDAFHASYLVDPSGTVSPLGPPPGPHHGPHGGPGPDDEGGHGPGGHGPDGHGPGDRGPDGPGPDGRGPDQGPPPPPPAATAAAPQKAPSAG